MAFPGNQRDFESIIYPSHAGEKMAERNVSSREVGETLRRPDRTYPGNKPDRIVAERDVEGDFTIRVVYVIEDEIGALNKVDPVRARIRRRIQSELGPEGESRPAAVVVTVIRIKRRGGSR